MNMASKSVKKLCYDAAGTGARAEWTLLGNAVMNNTTYPNAFYGKSDGVNAFSFFTFGNRKPWLIDKILAVEIVAQITNFNNDAVAYLGLGGDYNANPALAAQRAWFEIGGAAVGGERPIKIQTDDGTHDVSFSTGFTMPEDKYKLFRLDFRSGIQTVSPPGTCIGGKASVQYSITDSHLGYSRPTPPPSRTAHLDMSSYSGRLQPYFGVRQASGVQSDASIIVQSFDVWVEEETA